MTTTLITGASRGIGLELARQCAERGDEVIACCRNPSAPLEALGVRVESGVDVSSDRDVAALAKRVGSQRIDILINNAGVLSRQSLESLDWSEIRRQFEVNSLGPLRVTSALLDNLGDGSKIAIVTSRMGSIGDNQSGSSYGYRMSKAAVNMAGVSLARDLAGRNIAVILLHPGWVRTDMTGNSGHTDAPEAAGQLLERIGELTVDTSGTLRHANGEALPW